MSNTARAKTTRCIAVVGAQSSGKTTLVESMLLAAGAVRIDDVLWTP